MTDPAADPRSRRTRLVRTLMARRGQTDRLRVRAGDRTLEYGDRLLELHLREGERERLEALFDDYPVFKLEQPETRKATGGEVFVSAVADPKHLADFIEDCCRRVYGLPEGYELRVE